jgi:hypothetical protein
MKLTAKRLSELMGIDYASAANLLKLAVMTGQASESGKMNSPSGKGKPSQLYEVNSASFTFPLSPLVRKDAA